VAEFKTTFSANFSTFLWETHNELKLNMSIFFLSATFKSSNQKILMAPN